MNTAIKTKDRPTAADIVAELFNAAMPLFRRGATLYTREADGYRKLSPQRFLSWYEALTGKDAAHLSQAWAQQILDSAAVQDYATELPTEPLLTRAHLPQELSVFHIIVEDLSHYCAELQHHLTPDHARIITPVHHAEHPGIQQALHCPRKDVAELWGRLVHEPSQHVLLLIAQSRELALHALASETLRDCLTECAPKLGQDRHPHQSCPDCCIFVCYPRGTEQMSEHGAQPEKLCTPMAHIFTEEETRELFNKAYHAHHSTTEPADTQAESAPRAGHVVIPVRPENIKDLIPEVIDLVRHANAMHAAAEKARAGHTFPEWVQALALFFFLLFIGGCIGAAIALHLAGIIIK